MTTDDWVLRLREWLGQEGKQSAGARDDDPVGNPSRAGLDLLWQSAAAAVTTETPAMDLGDHFAVLARQPSAPVVSHNSSIGQAILSVLQGIRPRSNLSQVRSACQQRNINYYYERQSLKSLASCQIFVNLSQKLIQSRFTLSSYQPKVLKIL